MKKIAFIVSNLDMGGVQNITVQLANKLAEKPKNRVEIIVLNGNNSYYEVKCKATFLNVKYNFFNKVIRKLSYELLQNFYMSNILYLKALKKFFKKNTYDTIIASDGYTTMLLNEIYLQKVKKIGWMHNEYNTYMNNYFAPFKLTLGESLAKMDRVIVLNKADEKQYLQHNLRTTAIYNPLTIFKSQISDMEAKEILFVGRISREQKGLDLLLEIIDKASLGCWKLRIVGEGNDTEWLNNEIEKLGLKEKIILHGPVKGNIEKIYGNSSIFVSTSRWEGFGLVITEAMASGLPIIAFENAGPKEILADGKYGILIPKYDTNIFANELTKLIEGHEELLRYQKLSLQRSNDFKMDKIIQEWEAIINEE